jgi:hypothetical protein
MLSLLEPETLSGLGDHPDAADAFIEWVASEDDRLLAIGPLTVGPRPTASVPPPVFVEAADRLQRLAAPALQQSLRQADQIVDVLTRTMPDENPSDARVGLITDLASVARDDLLDETRLLLTGNAGSKARILSERRERLAAAADHVESFGFTSKAAQVNRRR